MAAPQAHVRKPSWKERLTSVSKRFGVGSPGKRASLVEDANIGQEESRDVSEAAKNATDPTSDQEGVEDSGDWCILDIVAKNGVAVHVDVNHASKCEVEEREECETLTDSSEDMEHTDGLIERLKGSKKTDKSDGKGTNATTASSSGLHSSPSSGGRRTSFGSRLKPEGSKLGRPGSPQPGGHTALQRRSSGRGRKLNLYDNVNGQASPRSGSPSRVGNTRKKNNIPGRTESPVPMDRRAESRHHQNGKNGSTPLSSSPSATGGESAFAKVRDTLKISKAKKKLKKKKGTAYSVAPVEINFPQTKYQDPFEAQPNFTDSSETFPQVQSHYFKPVSIPHNKPEYCDHCGETAWGLYRQVLKCSSEYVY